MFSPILFFLPISLATALVGYDCAGQHLNVTSISLLEPGTCNFDIRTTNTTSTYIQLLQLSDYTRARYIQCKAEVVRTIYHCGMHSHVSAVHHGQGSFLEEISENDCKTMHNEGRWHLGINKESFRGIKKNGTIYKSLNFAGEIGRDGKCNGISYSDPYGDWTNVFVIGYVKITLRDGFAPVHLATGKIILPSGTRCKLKDGYCLDSDYGYSFWHTIPTTTCDFHQYDVLYEGLANKTQGDTLEQNAPLVYSLETQDIIFALTSTTQLLLCGYALLKTEHPRLFILETTKTNVPKAKGDVPVDNLDIFTYVNSKFVYIEKHIRTQMTALYHNVIEHRCRLEREIIMNTLSLATLLPDEFAYRTMKGAGYMAVMAGEAIHIVKCIPVEVTVRRAKDCYIELPITVRNTSLFITPKSRIITKYGTQRECSRELPTLYNIEGTWVEFSPEPHVLLLSPQQLKPLTTVTWKYLTPGSLATNGIYSKQDIDKLRDHIMFPAEKPAVLNSLAMGMTGKRLGENTVSMYSLLDEDSLNKIADSAAKKIWSGFITFGSATAGVMGIFIIIRLIKLTIDTAIHGYALHSVYGCGLHLLGAIWSSLTHLLLHLAHKPPARHNKKEKSSKPDDNDDNEGNVPPTRPPRRKKQPANTPDEIIVEQPRAESTTISKPHPIPNPDGTPEDYLPTKSLTYKKLSERLDSL